MTRVASASCQSACCGYAKQHAACGHCERACMHVRPASASIPAQWAVLAPHHVPCKFLHLAWRAWLRPLISMHVLAWPRDSPFCLFCIADTVVAMLVSRHTDSVLRRAAESV